MDKRVGLYLGTEIDETWWKRYRKDKLFARGNGRYWFDKSEFCFHRFLTKEPIKIPYNKITNITLGTWHSGSRVPLRAQVGTLRVDAVWVI